MKLTQEDVEKFYSRLNTWLHWHIAKSNWVEGGYTFGARLTVCHRRDAGEAPFFRVAGDYGLILEHKEHHMGAVRPRVVSFQFLYNADASPAVVLDDLAHRIDGVERKVGEQILQEALKTLVNKDQEMQTLKLMEREAEQTKKLYEDLQLGLTIRMADAQQKLCEVEKDLQTAQEDSNRIADGGMVAVLICLVINFLVLVWR